MLRRAHIRRYMIRRQQLCVRALRRDASLVQDENAIGVADGREAMGDDERGAALAQSTERIEDRRLGNRVE